MRVARNHTGRERPVPNCLEMGDETRQPHLGSEGLTVLVPAHDEAESIPSVVQTIQATLRECKRPWEILVVDDGSTDGTARLAEELGTRVIRHGAQLGYGASLKTGIRRAAYDIIVITDADGTYPADRILDLVAPMDVHEMVVGARTGERVAIPPTRKPMKWILRKLAEFLAGVQIPDLNSGLRCFRKTDVQQYMHLLPNGFSFTTTLTLAYHSDSRLVHYLPVDYEKRTGRSKIRPLRDSYNFVLLILRTIMYFDPMRVLMPPALVSFGITAATLGYEIIWSRNLAEKSLLWLIISVVLFGLALLSDLIVRRRG